MSSFITMLEVVGVYHGVLFHFVRHSGKTLCGTKTTWAKDVLLKDYRPFFRLMQIDIIMKRHNLFYLPLPIMILCQPFSLKISVKIFELFRFYVNLSSEKYYQTACCLRDYRCPKAVRKVSAD